MNGGRLLARPRALKQIQIRKTSVVTVPVLRVYLCCGNTANHLRSPCWEATTVQPARSTNMAKLRGMRRMASATQVAQPGRESMAPDRRFSILKLWYGDRGRARYGNFILSLATRWEWRSESTTMAKRSVRRVPVRTP